MQKNQPSVPLGIYAVSIALATLVIGNLWLRESDKFTLNSIAGPRTQGDLQIQGVRFLQGHEMPKPVTPPPAWLQVVYALVRHDWNRPVPTRYPAIGITSAVTVHGVEQPVIQAAPVFPIVEYSATATTPGGRTFPLAVGIENPPLIQSTNAMASAPKSNTFYVQFPEKVPGNCSYLDVTLTGRGDTLRWRVHNLPRSSRLVEPPRQPTTTAKVDGVEIEALAWFLPNGKEHRVWTRNGIIVPLKRVAGKDPYDPTTPPVKGATLQTVRVEQDALQIACLLNFTLPQFPSPPPKRPDGFPAMGAGTGDNIQLVVEQVALEWGSEPLTPSGESSYMQVMPIANGPGGAAKVEVAKMPRIMAQAFGGEQRVARVTGRLDQYENIVTPVVFANVPLRQTGQGPRLDVGDGLKWTTQEGVVIILSDPNRTAKKVQAAGKTLAGRSRQLTPQMTYNAGGPDIPVRIDWELPAGRFGNSVTMFRTSPDIWWRDASDKWILAGGIPGGYAQTDTRGYFVSKVPKPAGNRIRGLGLNFRVDRRLKSTPLRFTVPIQSGLPANLPAHIR